jgi:hypothetical protein
MPRTHSLPKRLFTAALPLLGALQAPDALAQVPAPEPQPGAAPAAPAPGAPAVPAAQPADAGPPGPTAGEPADAAAALDPAALNAKIEKLQQAFDRLKAEQEAAAAAASEVSTEDSSTKSEPLKIYGFTDVGVQRVWMSEKSPIARLFPVNDTSFVVGNVNLYFDAQPIEHFRGLTELRFTNAPQGDVINYGGLAGTFERKSTFSYDTGGTAVNAPMWAGSVVLERAWLEWNEHQALKVRVGNFFTPFGIWNEDHGSPTLISLALPQFIIQKWIPIRQTGVMLYGSAFAGDWELGYQGTFTNGRQEISNLNFDNNFGVGGRLYARRDTGAVNSTFGLSYFTGTTVENRIDVVASPTGISGIALEDETTTEFTEHVLGADATVDIDATRIRAEAMVRRRVYRPGYRAKGDMLFSAGSYIPDAWQQAAYLLVAHQLPWAGLEPFLYVEAQEQPLIIGDALFVASGGLNVHFNAAVQLKTQAMRGYFMSWLLDSPYDPSVNNVTSVYSRLVMAF